MQKVRLFVVMGVSGVGKTTIGKLLAKELTLPFIDADDFHPKENIAKMSSGIPLNDEDRQTWLIALNKVLVQHQQTGAILACSALKESYRGMIAKGIEDTITFIFLSGTFEQLQERIRQRKDHFMPSGLLKSQFETLEPPEKAIEVSISLTPNEVIQQIKSQL